VDVGRHDYLGVVEPLLARRETRHAVAGSQKSAATHKSIIASECRERDKRAC
jgi:hypothetical protein